MKKLIIALGCIGLAAAARAGTAVQDNVNFDLPGMVGADLAGSAPELKLPQPDAVLSEADINGERSASVVPAWFSASKLSFVMLRKDQTGGFTAILRGGFFSITELCVFVEASGNTTGVFTEYSSNPMAAPKHKTEVTLNTAAARREVAAILREAHRVNPAQGNMFTVLKNLLSFLEARGAGSSRENANPGLSGTGAVGPVVPGCPGIDDIKAEWVEHTDPVDIPARLRDHLDSALVQSGPVLLSIHRVPYYLGVARRGDLLAQADLEPGCQVTGTVAYYVIGEEGAPEINFDLIMADPAGEKALGGRLSELRWFDLKDGRRHRWYNLELAASRGWLVDEYGNPTPDYRPIETFTNSINDLY